jgi:formate/nitrite transporter FocA (FNT family)
MPEVGFGNPGWASHANRNLQMILLIAACLAGIFLGLKYNFIVLIPVTIVAGSIWGASALLNGLSVSTTLVEIVIPSVSLQAGYMLGLTSRDFISQIWSTLAGFSGREYR